MRHGGGQRWFEPPRLKPHKHLTEELTELSMTGHEPIRDGVHCRRSITADTALAAWQFLSPGATLVEPDLPIVGAADGSTAAASTGAAGRIILWPGVNRTLSSLNTGEKTGS
jgi:hypothetical protein